MIEVQRIFDAIDTLQPPEEVTRLLVEDAMNYGVAFTITDADRTVRRIPPPEAIR